MASKEFEQFLPVRDVLEIKKNEKGNWTAKHKEIGFEIELFRYTDPDRLNLADSAAIYLGKPDTDNIKRPLSIMKLGHALEVFRGESATFKFYNVAKQVYDHLVTYKTMNMRVAGGNRALVSTDYTMPMDKMKDPDSVSFYIEDSMLNYKTLIDMGETPQVARAAMPVNANMNPFKLQFNFQTLIESLFVQRIWEPGAQGLTVEVVRAMFWLCHNIDPELWEQVFELYGPHTKGWKEAQKKLRRKGTTVSEWLFEIGNVEDPTTNGKKFYDYLIEDLNYNEEDAFDDTVLHAMAIVWDMKLEEAIREHFGKVKEMW